MSFLFILLGAFGFYLTQGSLGLWPTAWLFAIPILWVTRSSRGLSACVFVAVALGAAGQAAMWKFTDDSPSSLLFWIPLMAGIPLAMIFAADRWAASRLRGFLGTMFFPALWASFDFLLNLLNPLGTLGVLGYSQAGFLPIASLASVSGMWGVTFVVAWFGSIVVWAIRRHREGEPMAMGVAGFSAAFASVLLYGLIRPSAETGAEVMLAGLHFHDRDSEGVKMWKLLDDRNLDGFRKISGDVLDRLESGTADLAEQGAQIVVWSELSPTIVLADEAATKDRLSRLARTLKIYLLACPYVANLVDRTPENKAWLFGPDGRLLATHFKFGGNLLEGVVEGDKKIPIVETEFGRVAIVICWDGDFPTVLRQVGQQSAGLLLVPASDWREIGPAHARLTQFRGIENGCSVVRQTQNGVSMISDPAGRIVSSRDHFASADHSMFVSVKLGRAFALYPALGDWFGWFSLAGAMTLGFLAAARRPETTKR